MKFLVLVLMLFTATAAWSEADDDGFGLKGKDGTVQYYDFSVGGLEEYMDVLRYENPTVYNDLKDEFADMQNRANWVSKTNITLLGTSAVLAYIAFQPTRVKKTERITLGNEEYYQDTEEYEFRNQNLGILALAGIVSTVVINYKWGVSSQEIRGFINKHNRMNEASPLRIALESDMKQSNDNLTLTLSYAF